MARTLLTILAVILLVLCAADYPDHGVAGQAAVSTSVDIELADGWTLTEAD